METGQIIVFVAAVLSAANAALNGNQNVLISKTKDQDDFIQKYNLVSKLSTYPKLIYSSNMKAEMEHMMVSTPTTCLEDVAKIIDDLDVPELYAMEMIDSIGKPGSGILQGNFQWLGNFDQCKEVEAFDNITHELVFTGRYCLPSISNISLTFGLCVPDSCNDVQVEAMMNLFLDAINSNENATVHCVSPLPWRPGDTAMTVVVAIFVVLVISSTVYEFHFKYRRRAANSSGFSHNNKTSAPATAGKSDTDIQLTGIKTVTSTLQHTENDSAVKDEKIHPDQAANGSTAVLVQTNNPDITKNEAKPDMMQQIFQSFSLLSNGKKLISMTSTPKGMESLNGMRVISMAWVILGHSFSTLSLFTTNGLALVEKLPTEFTFQFVLAGESSVDTFFFLSGFLVMFGTMKILKKTKGRLNWGLYYLSRILRLTPIYMFVLFFYITVSYHFISGPYESEERTAFAVDPCFENWWTNLLYINNFLPENPREMCIQWSWYLANDMQFYIISPLFIYLVYRKRIIGYVLTAMGILSNMMAVGIVANKYDVALPPAESTVNPDDRNQYEDFIYFRPYYRIAPYLVGLAFADIYINTKDKVKNMKATWWKVFVVVMWLLTIGMLLTLVYGLYPQNHVGADTYISPKWLGELYMSTHRFVWALCCAWIAFACLTGWGGPINSFLSMKIWEPMVRLCFIMYLAHPMIMALFLFNLKQNVYVHELLVGFWFIGYVGATFAVSIVFFLLVEQPLSRLQRILLKK